MRQLCRQLYWVAALYVLKPKFWLIAIFCGFMFVLVAIIAPRGINLLFLASMASVATQYLMENIRQQFLHSRSRLLPNFARAHAAVPFAVALAAGITVPALISRAALSSMAFIFAWTACSVLLRRFPFFFTGIFRLIIITPLLSGYSFSTLTEFDLELPPILSIALALLSAGTVVLALRRFAHLAEDDPLYLEEVNRSLATPELTSELTSNARQRRPLRHSFASPAFATAASDRKLSEPLNFHDHGASKIADLLRLSLGAQPPLLKAAGGTVLYVVVACLLLSQVSADEDSDFLVGLWLLSTLFASLLPGAQGGLELSQHRPYLVAELMRPLTRKQLIDGFFVVTFLNTLVEWLITNAGAVVILFFMPGVTISVSLLATYLALSASIATLMFGLALYDIKLTSSVERIIWLVAIVVACFGTTIFWWMARTTVGDLPFWLIAAALAAAGIFLRRYARELWLNLELG